MQSLRLFVGVAIIGHLFGATLLAEDNPDSTVGRASIFLPSPSSDDEPNEISAAAMEEYALPPAVDYPSSTPDRYQLQQYESESSEIFKVTGGASIYYLKPYAEGNTAYQVTTITSGVTGGTSTAVGQTTNQNFNWDMQPAAAFWLGATTKSGLGIQTRFFFMGGSSQDAQISLTPGQAFSTPTPFSSISNVINPSPYTPPTFPGALPPVVAGSQSFSAPSQLLAAGVGRDDLSFGSTLKINALDLEPTFNWALERWTIQAGSGLRYLQMTQTYRANLQNLGGGAASEFETLSLSNKYWGVGPTVSGRFSRTVGETGLRLFSGGRASFLVGNSGRVAGLTDVLNDPLGLTTGVPGTFVQRYSQIPSSTDQTMTVLELELGLEYGRVIYNHYWYCRGSMVDQTYFNSGNASRTTGNLSLFGCQFTAGFDF